MSPPHFRTHRRWPARTPSSRKPHLADHRLGSASLLGRATRNQSWLGHFQGGRNVSMSNLVGADVGELRALAATFNARAAQLKSIESQLSWRIQAAPWEGHDVSRFVQDWNTRHRRVILGAAASVTSAAQELLANAEQQELASTA